MNIALPNAHARASRSYDRLRRERASGRYAARSYDRLTASYDTLRVVMMLAKLLCNFYARSECYFG